MDFKKLGLGLALTASFGLMACGDDSSSSPTTAGDLTPKCSVSSTDNSVGYTVTSGSVSTVFTAKVNKDGSITYTSTQTFPSSTFSSSELKMECEAAKKDASGENVELTCNSDKIAATWTEDANEDVSLADLKKEYQLLCDMTSGKNPSFDFDDDDDDSSDDDDKKQPGSSSKEDCSFKMDSDTWSYGYYNIGLGGDMTKTYTISGNEYKILYTYKGESLDAQSTSGKFSDSYTRKDMFNEAQDHCLTVNGLKDSSDDEDDDDDYESPVGSDDDDDYGFDSPVDMDSLLSEVEKMPECTKSNEGDKTTYLGMSMICKDGEWEPDMEDLGIDLGNCDSFKKSDDVWTKTMNVMGMEMTETYKWIDATTVEYTSSVKGLEAFADTETLEDQDRDDLYEYFCEE